MEQTPTPKKPRLKHPPTTIKERKFAKEYLKTGNGTLAAMAAYDVKSSAVARSLGSQVLSKLSIIDVLDKHGVTDDKIAQVMIEGLEANRVISANVVLTRSDDPTVEEQSANSLTKDFIEVPDHAVRHKFMETAYKLRGHLKQNESQIDVNVPIAVVLSGVQAQVIEGNTTPEDDTERR